MLFNGEGNMVFDCCWESPGQSWALFQREAVPNTPTISIRGMAQEAEH